MPPLPGVRATGNVNHAQVLTNQLLNQMESGQTAAVRNANAQIQVELGMVRAALPDPNKLLAIAHALDTILPHDDQPEMQYALRDWAQHIYGVTRSDQAGHVAYDALSKALKYADIMIKRQQGDNPKLAQGSVALHQQMMTALEGIRALFTGDSHGEEVQQESDNGQPRWSDR